MARLLHHFAPVFSFGLALDEKVSANAAGDPPANVLAAVRTLIDRAKAAALADGKRAEHVDDATFAVVAWIDEIMARNPAYLTGNATPLQVALYNTNNAGNEFFSHLSALRAEHDEVREVYYHALLLGFVGQYYYETGDGGELGKLKELHARQLPVAPAPIHTLREERITPQPYAGDAPGGPRYPKQWDRLLLKTGVIAALLVPLAYLAYLLIAAPKETGPSVQALVDRQLAGFPCSDLVATVGEKGATRVEGFVSRADDVAAVRQRVSAVDGVTSPRFDLQLRIWPHCEVVQMLKPYRERNGDLRYGLSVTPTSGHSDRFLENERVIVKLMQATYDGYLYVDYYTVGGDVAHIYPNPHESGSGRVIRAGEQFNVGATDQRFWTVGPPFGQELITVIASPTPLFQGDPAVEVESAKDYLPRLGQLLEANRDNPELAAEFLFMQTEPAP
ncbi:DotU family type IV/VI secretion system protein [Luteimonas salinilitoris]|uniref:DotU family type IV/VI secretion system protein n=1 Tax=Luteimonas salinilitoris TaxID=3237697 RepID=A0ABV4HRY4_9GAMM